MTPESEGLRSRIRQLRHSLGSSSLASTARLTATGKVDSDEVVELKTRIAHLEQMVQGLQDSVYRESQRQERRIAELEARLDPTTLAAALSKDARERGL